MSWAALMVATAGLAAREAPAQAPAATKKRQIQQSVRRAGTSLLAYSTTEARAALQPWIKESHADVQTTLGRILTQEKKYAGKDLTINDFRRFLALASNAPEAQRVQRLLQSIGG